MADWYDQYVLIYSRLRKRAPRSYHSYSAAGADALGVRQSHGVPFGTGHLPQPDFVASFGEESFEVNDATSQSAFLGHVRRTNPTVSMASPPCKAHSTSDMEKRSTAPDLIGLTRDHCRATGRLYVIENVKGAAAEMEDHPRDNIVDHDLLHMMDINLGAKLLNFFTHDPVIFGENL